MEDEPIIPTNDEPEVKEPYSNTITVLRKKVNNNIPGFDDPEVGQNDWIKMYDFTCVDAYNCATVQNYDLEADANYDNTANKISYSFIIETPRQSILPPYDVNTGDYVVYKQGTTLFMWRIVKINQTQMFKNCSVYELITTMLQPMENNIPLETGVFCPVELEDLKGVKI